MSPSPESATIVSLAAQHDYEAYRDALQFMQAMQPEFRKCRRRRRHDFEDGQFHGDINADGTIHTEIRCNDCGTVKIEDTTAWGYYIKTPRYIWPDGYLKSPDDPAMVTGEDASAAMRAVRMYERLGKPIPSAIGKVPAKKRTATKGA
jgi:hypothetical protein